ncbi:hypothetical protein HBN50_06355 [Halobacteriovorax sp. GB3]|uniref:tRNA pseudouridine synthase B n=1 Tax=Halobacteriovorax sp. GB3 TaxID=2719615 RepID=UPI0023602287|nr:hypothetical protein [Halobacteriovorax sp. GB3]MDD0852709.1 hypothetical protein [Halobacteriovorax sp. GB3]
MAKKNRGPEYGPFLFNVYKPVGVTSFDVIRAFKYNLPKGFGKIGHFGTLDPFAEGVLMVATGPATRLTDRVHEMTKTYIAKGVLGIHSPTGDLTAKEDELIKSDCTFLKEKTLGDFKSTLESKFQGDYMQVPPHFSATKHEGKALHEWARQGVLIEKEAVKRFIHNIEIIEFDYPHVIFRATVSSGTYIRTLFEDMAKEFATTGALKELCREKIGPISMANSIHTDNWPKRGECTVDDLLSIRTTFEELFDLPKCEIPEGKRDLLFNGADVHCDYLDGEYLVVDQGVVIALADVKKTRLKFKVRLFI